MTQVADHAPRHFRTLRSSHKFLVPVEKKEEYTGVLVDKDGVRLGRGYKARREHFDAVRGRVERVERSEGGVSFGLVNVDGTIERPHARSGVESILRARGAWMEMQEEVERDVDEFIRLAEVHRLEKQQHLDGNLTEVDKGLRVFYTSSYAEKTPRGDNRISTPSSFQSAG